MKKRIISFLLVLIVGFSAIAYFDFTYYSAKAEDKSEEKIYSNATIDDEFVDNVVMLILKRGTTFKDYSKKDFKTVGCESVEDLTSARTNLARQGSAVAGEDYNRILKLTLREKSKENVLNAVNILMERNDVLHACPDYIIKVGLSSSGTDLNIAPDMGDRTVQSDWWFSNINLSSCNQFSTGSKQIKVGVLDTGIDASHPDFGIGEDSNISNISGVIPTPDSAYIDTHGHGTHVAGIIGAKGTLVKGVCQDIDLVPLKYSCGSLGEALSNIAYLINVATQENIPIVNISSCPGNEGGIIDDYLNIVSTAISNYPGLVVCCAGNDRKNVDQYLTYPACYDLPNIISVGAINSINNIATWESETVDGSGSGSNYGANNIDIYAPGYEIYSTWKMNEEGYKSLSGTSQAAPFVSGVAALLLSINPNLTTSQLKTAILNSAETITISVGETSSTQQVKKLNAYNAVKYVLKNYGDQITIGYGNVSYTKQLDPTSTIYNEHSTMIKMTVTTPYNFGFNITSMLGATVKLYNSNFGLETIDQTITNNNTVITFNKTLSVGTYYLEIKSSSGDTANSVSLLVTGQHQHDYTSRYRQYNDLKHRSYCSCGEFILEPHALMQGNVASCYLCNALMLNSLSLNVLTRIATSENGSYVLSNGIVVLVYEDLQAYLRKELRFFATNSENA